MSKRPANKTGAVSLLLLFYFFFFLFIFEDINVAESRPGRLHLIRSRCLLFFIWHFLSFLIFFWYFLPAGLLVFPSRLAFIQVGEQILDFFRGSEKRREKETDRHARGRRRRKKGRRAIYTQEENSGQQAHPTWRERETDALLLKRHSVAT